MKKQRIQIPTSLYNLMTEYIKDHYDPCDRDRFFEIQRGIQEKKLSNERHNIYTSYKTEANPEVKEILRTIYLNKTGIPSHGRWELDYEPNLRTQDHSG